MTSYHITKEGIVVVCSIEDKRDCMNYERGHYRSRLEAEIAAKQISKE